MRNPPSFIVYVVLAKMPDSDKFDPYWSLALGPEFSPAFASKKGAQQLLKHAQRWLGKENAYIQQYGPIS